MLFLNLPLCADYQHCAYNPAEHFECAPSRHRVVPIFLSSVAWANKTNHTSSVCVCHKVGINLMDSLMITFGLARRPTRMSEVNARELCALADWPSTSEHHRTTSNMAAASQPRKQHQNQIKAITKCWLASLLYLLILLGKSNCIIPNWVLTLCQVYVCNNKYKTCHNIFIRRLRRPSRRTHFHLSVRIKKI